MLPVAMSAPTINTPDVHSRIYRPLDRSQKSFRLLSIGGGNGFEIDCRLTTFASIDHCPAFIAASYVWTPKGQPVAYARIRLDGYAFNIGWNLYEFLSKICLFKAAQQIRSQMWDIKSCFREGDDWKKDLQTGPCHPMMRDPTQWQYLWIDALCIDQSSLSERSYQVSLMGDIYKSATFVLAWLGIEADDSRRAMHFMATNQSFLRKTDERCTQGFDNPYTIVEARTVKNPEYDPTFMTTVPHDAIRKLFQRDYWTRIWIVQEFVLGRDMLFMCGDAFAGVTSVMQYMQRLDPTHDQPLTSLVRHRFYKEDWPDFSRGQPELYRAILDFMDWGCGDRRDRVFGMLGMAKSKIKPDYELDALQLYEAVLRDAMGPHRRVKGNYGRQLSWREIYEPLIHALSIDKTEGTLMAKRIYSQTSSVSGCVVS